MSDASTHDPGDIDGPSPGAEATFTGLTEIAGLAPANPDHDPILGNEIGDVTIVRVIAEGGMGRVYEGIQDKPRRPVAVKVMRPGLLSRDVFQRFNNESEVLGRLRHPYIAQIYSAGICPLSNAHLPYFVMEYIADALPLTQYVSRHNLGTDHRLDLFRKVCEAVAHGHEKGVIHRDLKPSNILVEPSGVPKIIDFGVARTVDAFQEQTTTLTGTGQLIGTVQYMSPEQITADAAQIDTRSDVYSLGVILYELLTGSPPYEIRRKQIFQAAEVVCNHKPVPPSQLNRSIGPKADEIVRICLNKEPSQRYASAAELANALRLCLGMQAAANGQPYCDSISPRRAKPAGWSRSRRAVTLFGIMCVVAVVVALANTPLATRRPASGLATAIPDPEGTVTAPATTPDRSPEGRWIAPADNLIRVIEPGGRYLEIERGSQKANTTGSWRMIGPNSYEIITRNRWVIWFRMSSADRIEFRNVGPDGTVFPPYSRTREKR